jgi:leucyl-tRNA synthetase
MVELRKALSAQSPSTGAGAAAAAAAAASVFRAADAATTFLDRVFENQMNQCINESFAMFKSMQFHEAMRAGFWNLRAARDEYRANCGQQGMKVDLLFRYIESFLIVVSPVLPHFSQHCWELIGKQDLVCNARWPQTAPEDKRLSAEMTYLRDLAHNFRTAHQRLGKAAGKNGYIYVARVFPAWQQFVIDLMRAAFAQSGDESKLPSPQDVQKELAARNLMANKKDISKAMQFVSLLKRDAAARGLEAFNLSMLFDEEKLINDNIEFVRRGVPVEAVRVFDVSDKNAPQLLKEPVFTEPGKPIVVFERDPSAEKPEGKPKAAAPKP